MDPRIPDYCDKTPVISPDVLVFWVHWRDRAARLHVAANMSPEDAARWRLLCGAER